MLSPPIYERSAGATVLPWPVELPTRPRRRLGPGRILFHEGDAADFAYEVASGMLKLTKLTVDGNLLILDFVGPGEMIGLTPGGKRVAYSAQAVGEASVHPIARSALLQRIAQQTDAAERLLGIAGRKEQAMHDHLLLLSTRHPAARLAAFLMQTARRQSPDDSAPGRVSLPMARRDIADHLVIAPETVCRLMRRLRESRVINVLRCDDVEILRWDRLEAIAHGSASLR